jgi:hypothetical protein
MGDSQSQESATFELALRGLISCASGILAYLVRKEHQEGE